MRLVKRTLDYVLALPLLIIGSPIFGIAGFLVGMDGGPVFYAHPRIGRYGRPFQCYKFRTMIVGAGDCLDEYLALDPVAAAEWQRDQKLHHDPRITGIGKLLRRTSLDELPQLFNVLKGDMSLVGPRPITRSELQRYGDHADAYKTILPGLTGLWQVSGRNRLTYSERVAIDAKYIASQSFWLDVVILFKTIRVLTMGDGK